MALILLALGVITLVYLMVVLRQWRTTRDLVIEDSEPVFPVNLVDNDNAVLVAEGRGRLVYMNSHAQAWFGVNGDEPNLMTLANRVQPADTFHDLFAYEGRVNFRIGQRQIEATSHLIPGGIERRMVVVMRELSAQTAAQEDFDAAQAIHIIGEISTMLAQAVNLGKTLESILHTIGKVILYDAGEINYWDEEHTLLRPIANVGDPNYAAALRDAGDTYQLDEGFTGWLARYRQPIVIGSSSNRHRITPKIVGYPFNSFIGIPLMVGDRFIGTLELANRQKNAFGYQDLNLLQSLSGQVAVAIENSRLYREQSNRLAELSGLQKIAQSMVYLAEPEVMFEQLASSIADLMDVHICGVFLFNEDQQVLLPQPPLFGLPGSMLSFAEFKPAGILETSSWHSNATFDDPTVSALNLNTLVEMNRIHALALVPMLIGTTQIGAVMAGNPRDGGGFSDDDIHSLTVFASEVAIVVENARLYKQEKRRAEELEGLQEIAQAIGFLRDPREFYAQITSRIAKLMGVEMCGIWTYREVAHALVAHPPFWGASNELMDDYPLPLSDNPLIAKIWEAGKYGFSNDIQKDAGTRSQFGHLAQEIGMEKTAVAVLRLGGEKTGLLQIANPLDGGDFDEQDTEVLSIFAGQVEVMVENARLYTETRQRALESDNLRYIAEQLSSSGVLDDTLSDVLDRTTALLRCEALAVALLDTERGKLVYDPTRMFGREPDSAIEMDMFSQGFVHSPAISRRVFASDNVQTDSRVLPPYLALAERIGITNTLIVPLVIQNQSVGEIMAINKLAGRFDENDQSLLQAVAAQVAASIERTRLYAATDADLRARLDELNAIDRIGQELAENLDLDHILEVTRSEVLRGTAATGISLVLFLPPSEWLNAQEPLIELRRGGSRFFSPEELTPIEEQALAQNAVVYVADYLGSDLAPVQEDTRSAVVDRLMVEGETLGLLHVYSDAPNAFSETQRDFLSRVAKQTSLALANARRYREQIRLNEILRGRANQLSKVYSLGQMIRQGATLGVVLEELGKALVESIGFRQVLIQVVDEGGDSLELISKYGLSEGEDQVFQQTAFSPLQAQKLLQERWQLGKNAYFLPAEYKDEWFVEKSGELKATDLRSWHPADLMVAPMWSAEGEFIGWISVEAPEDGRRPTIAIAETIEVFAAEAAFSIENYRLLQSIRDEAAGTRAERDRLALLHLVASDIQRTPDMPGRLQSVVEGIQAAGWNKVRITMRDENLDHLLLVYAGYTEEEVIRLKASVLPGQVWRDRFNDPAFQALALGAAYYLRYDTNWVAKNILRGQKPNPVRVPQDEWHPQDIIYLPLYGQNKRILGIVAMESPTDNARPTETSLQPIELFATQAAAAIENTLLYLETVRREETEHRLTAMMESVAATLDFESVLRTLAEGLQQMIAFTRMHVGLPSPSGKEFHLQRVEILADGNVYLFDDAPLPLEGTAMGRVFQGNLRQTVNLLRRQDAGKDQDLQRWYEQGERITLMVPMIAGGETLGVLRLGSELENAFGFAEHLDLVGRMANLSAVAINHSRLVNNLMSSTAYNEAVVESIQQGIVVLDRNHIITSINAFMKHRYGWSDAGLGKVLYDFEPEFGVFLRHSINTALEEGTPQHQFEIQDFDTAGNRMIRNFYTYPLREGDKVSGVVLLIEDVTERAMLESNLEQRAEQLSALTTVSSKMTSTLAYDDVVAIVLEALENVMPFDGVTLWLREGDTLRVSAARGFRDEGAPSVEELVGLYVDLESSMLFKEMAANQQVINVGDTGANDPRFPYGEQRVYKNWLGAPLMSQAEVIGVIALEKREPNYYDNIHEQLLQAFGNQAAVAFRNAQLFEQTTNRAHELDAKTRRLELLNRVAVALAQSLDIENIFEITLRETALALDIPEASALKIDHENELARLVVEFPRGDKEPDLIYSTTNNLIIARLRETLLPLVIDDLKRHPLGETIKPWLRRDDVQSTLIVPLVVGGTIIGIMHFDTIEEGGYYFNQERLDIAQTLASQGAIAVQNASLFEQSVTRTHELETLFEASQATSVTLDLNEAMRRVVSQMLSALRADYCSISLWDDVENQLEIRQAINSWGDSSESEPPGTTYNLSDYPLREYALRQREVMVLRPDREDLDATEKALMQQNGTHDRLLVPLVVNDFSIGMIDLEIREQTRVFDTSDIRLARTLASQSAIAIENARLQTETRAQIEELYIINDLSTAVSSKVNVDELFPMVRDQLPVLTDADILYVALYDPQTQKLTFPVAVNTDGKPMSMGTMSLGVDEFSYIINHKAPLLLWGSRVAEVGMSYGITTVLEDAKCFLGVPMLAGDEVVGVLAVQDNTNPRAFGLNDQRILTTVASQLAVAVQNARLFAQTSKFAEDLELRVTERTGELTQERERVQALYDITTEAASSLDIHRVLSRSLAKVAQAIEAHSAVILGIDELSNRLTMLHAYGEIQVPEGEMTYLSPDEGLAGWVLKNHQGVVIPDVQKDERWLVRKDTKSRQRSAVAALLEVGEDSRGVMMLFSNKVGAFNEEHLKLVTAAASQLANSMNNAELYSLIRDQAERLGAILRKEQVESTKNTAILDSIADGVMYANEQGTVVLFNTAAERILGLPAEHVTNRAITELTGLYGGSSGLWMDSMERWMGDPASHQGTDFVEELLELDDGRVVSVRLSPVTMGDQFLGTVSVFRDITKIVEVDRLKSEFVSTVSHELRTPMTSIKGYADLLLLGAAGEVSEAQQRFLETIKANADRLSILVNDLLEVSRIDQDRVPLRFTAVEIPDLLQNIADHLRGRIQDQKPTMQVKIEAAGDLPALRADYDRTIQIMQNLADNAFNYTNDGGTITLSARYQEDKNTVILSVQDTGIGIPESARNRVFERFYRGDEYHDLVLDTPGTGLGLSIVRSLVEMHGGTIWFETEIGVGTTFHVEMPIMQQEQTPS